MAKLLLIRFSSIGDIILTTPIIRCLKTQLQDCEIHYLTKLKFASVLKNNPYIDKLYTIDKDLNEILPELKDEEYDRILDMHKSLRSMMLILKLKRPWSVFGKLSIRKWIYYKLHINLMPDLHIVDRYFKTFGKLGIVNDQKGLDYFIDEQDTISEDVLPNSHKNGYIAVVAGANYYTKQIPTEQLTKFCKSCDYPLILLGGNSEVEKCKQIEEAVNDKKLLNCCGKFTLGQSAFIIKNSSGVLTPDTGLMHMAAAFKKPIISMWGTTSVNYGVAPYMPEFYDRSVICEPENLKCSPCSKFGLNKCPKNNFRCMNDPDMAKIAEKISILAKNNNG